MSFIMLRNKASGESLRLTTPFTEKEYFNTLEALHVPYDREEWIRGDVEGVEVDAFETDGFSGPLIHTDNPVLYTLAEEAYRKAWNTNGVWCYGENIGFHDVEAYINVCLQSDDMNYYTYEEGTSYEGYGREMLRWQFESGEIPDYLEGYIDYEEYGRDSADYDFVDECGYLCGDTGVSEDYYTFDEICDELDWDLEFEPDHEPGRLALTSDLVLSIL